MKGRVFLCFVKTLMMKCFLWDYFGRFVFGLCFGLGFLVPFSKFNFYFFLLRFHVVCQVDRHKWMCCVSRLWQLGQFWKNFTQLTNKLSYTFDLVNTCIHNFICIRCSAEIPWERSCQQTFYINRLVHRAGVSCINISWGRWW